MGRFLSSALGYIVAAAILWLVVAPYWAFFALRSAAQSNDAAAMAELIDYPKVKASLRDQIEPGRAPGPPPNIWEDPVGALRRSLEPLQPSPTADSYLTPQSVAALTMGMGRDSRRLQPTVAEPDDNRLIARPYPGYRYWGLNLVRLAIADDEQGETMFTFARKGFGWKLVHVGLPPLSDGTTVAPPAAQPAPAPKR